MRYYWYVHVVLTTAVDMLLHASTSWQLEVLQWFPEKWQPKCPCQSVHGSAWSLSHASKNSFMLTKIFHNLLFLENACVSRNHMMVRNASTSIILVFNQGRILQLDISPGLSMGGQCNRASRKMAQDAKECDFWATNCRIVHDQVGWCKQASLSLLVEVKSF